MKLIIRVGTSSGETVEVDISDEACLRFGFRHGDLIIDPDGDNGIIMGVATEEEDQDNPERGVMWYVPVDDSKYTDGDAYYRDSQETDLRQEGFKLIGGPSFERMVEDREIVPCMKVIGRAGDKVDEVIVFDLDTAFAQQRAFESAGYVTVIIQPTHAVHDAEKDVWYRAVFEGPIEMNKEAVPAKYSRADINPGVNVYVYDRDVLNRQKVTLQQVLLATGVAAILAITPLWLLGELMVKIVQRMELWAGLTATVAFVVFGFIFGIKWLKCCGAIGNRFAGITPSRE